MISERMGEYMLTLSRHIMQNRRFVRYPEQMKDDMVQEGVLKIVKNLKNMKAGYKDSFFAYWSMCVFTSAYSYLKKHYKNINQRREMLAEALNDVYSEMPANSPRTRYIIKELEQMI